jgi:hypothetical protein
MRREAAERLRWPEGTVAWRLARGRALLAERLARHGPAPAAGALTAALSQKAAPASVPPALMVSTVRAASLVAVGEAAGVIPAQVAGLTEGVVRAMAIGELRTAAVVALVGVLGAAAVTCAVLAAGQGGRAGAGAEGAPKPVGEKLSARISVKSKLPLRTETLDADLVLTNDGDKPLRVGLLCGEWRAMWTAEGVTTYRTTFRPDLFKSDPPTEEQRVKNIVTLEPGDTAALAMPVTAATVRAAGRKLRLAAAYEVGEEFAGKHHTWAGRIEAKPVLVTLQTDEAPRDDDRPAGDADRPKEAGADKPKGKDLSLVAERDSWQGRPYVKVYVVNPANAALELTDRHVPPFDISMLCTVKVDGADATVLSDGDFTLGPARKKTLPADSKTLLGLLALDRKVAAHFGGYTPVLYRNCNGSLELFGPGKHTLEIGAKEMAFPTSVTPATIEVDLGPGD